jgi:probable rRNA maturation factor
MTKDGPPDVLVIDVANQTRYVVDPDLVTRLVRTVLEAEGVSWGELGVQFVGEHHIRLLNRDHMHEDHVTDVLAFPLERSLLVDGRPVRREPEREDDAPPRLLGDVVVCLLRAESQARRAKLPLALEVALLLVHGTLHVVGYDHDADAGQMALRQAQLLEAVAWEGLVAQG